MNEKKTDPVSVFKDAIVAKAAEALVAELSPERLKEIVEQVLKQALSEISSDQYSAVGRMIREKLAATTKDYLETPEAKTLMRTSVEEGVKSAFDGPSFTSEVKGRVTDLALKGLTESLSSRIR